MVNKIMVMEDFACYEKSLVEEVSMITLLYNPYPV